MPKTGHLEIELDEDVQFKESDLEHDLEFDMDTLQTAIIRHGGLYWKYGKMHALAIRVGSEMQTQIEAQKREMDLLESQLNEYYRGQLLASGEKATEKAIDVQVKKDVKYLQAADRMAQLRSELIMHQYTENILALAEKIFSKRTDLLTTLGFMFRSTAESDGLSIPSRNESLKRETDKLRAGAAAAIKTNKKGRR